MSSFECVKSAIFEICNVSYMFLSMWQAGQVEFLQLHHLLLSYIDKRLPIKDQVHYFISSPEKNHTMMHIFPSAEL